MSNSNFVVTPATTNPSGIKSLDSILSPAPFFDPTGNLNMNGLALIGNADSATQIALTSDNTNGAYFIPFSKTASSTLNSLYIDNITAPLTYNPSSGTMLSQVFFAAASTSTTVFSQVSNTAVQVINAGSNTTIINSNQITCSQVSPAATTTITPTTVTSTTFVTSVAPVSGNQLGNKTYIDNFGGTGGWYYTATVSVTAGTTFAFPNSLSNNLNNAYEIYFAFNITSATIFPTVTLTLSGLGGSVFYTNWTTTSTTGGVYTNTNTTGGSSFALLNSFGTNDTTVKVDLWGTQNANGGSVLTQFLTENYGVANPGSTAWLKSFGFVTGTSAYPTGVNLIFSGNVTGSITIIVKAKY